LSEAMAFTKRPGGFAPTPRFAAQVAENYADGAVYWLTPEPQRSEKSHGHEFAWLTEAWKTLPDHLTADYPTSEFLRKKALIATGWHTVQDYVCSSRAEAARWVENLRREADKYAVIVPSGTVVRVFKARSQSKAAMGAADFQASKTAILEWVAGLLDVAPEALLQARAA
jgi:hypothetical protein